MTNTNRIINFSAGPAAVPESVLLEAQSNLFNYKGLGLSVMEMSHRSAAYDAIHNDAINDLKTLLNVPDNYRILFLQGGASMQFAMLPMNFAKHQPVDVIHTGSWTKKAIDELKKGYQYRVVASSEDQNFLGLPDASKISFNDDAAYTYMCSNNTIFGTQFKTFPTHSKRPLVVDMSSDILSRPLNVSDFGIIFAGAQKNIGPSGVTVVIIKDELLNTCHPDTPVFFNYTSHASANSLYNTPPTFGIYIAHLVFKRLLELGGLNEQEKQNTLKANCLYQAIDESSQFYCPVPKEDRSPMNVVFRHQDHNESIESAFISEAKAAGFDGLKGHRSVGGLRASIYNAQELAHIEQFSTFIREFSKKAVVHSH